MGWTYLQLSSRSSIHSILCVSLLTCLLSWHHSFSFRLKCLPSLEEASGPQSWDVYLCLSSAVSCGGLCTVISSWCNVACPLIVTPDVCGKSGFNCAWKASFSSSVVCFKIRNQLLGQIIVICQLNKAINKWANWKKVWLILTSWNQSVRPNCQLIILSFTAKLPYHQLVMC